MKTLLLLSCIFFLGAGCQKVQTPGKPTTDIIPSAALKEVNPEFFKVESCPFYEPDGVSYRECLGDQLEMNKKSLTKKDFEEYSMICEHGSEEYKGFIAEQNYYLSCMVNKLENIN